MAYKQLSPVEMGRWYGLLAHSGQSQTPIVWIISFFSILLFELGLEGLEHLAQIQQLVT